MKNKKFKDNVNKVFEKLKEHKWITLSFVIVLLLLIVLGTTYAYFTANVLGNEKNGNVVITNGVMSLKFTDGSTSDLKLENAVPGDSITKTFSVENTGNVDTKYTIYFSELINTFVDQSDLVYTLTSDDGGANIEETQVPNISSTMIPDVKIESGKIHNYSLKITFKETNESQDDNQVWQSLKNNH